MAEFVEQSMEEMLPELEQLQRVQLLSSDEVKQVIKMRRRFEYKIQKKTKNKEDFLSYIQYESSLLSLVSIRRDKIDYEFKKNEIDYSIARRINKLFRILEHRFGKDMKIWMSHIDFLKNMSWKVELSKVLRRFIQAHTAKPEVWMLSAKVELEFIGNPDTARKIMLEGLRFHPDSQDLYREYFRLEVMYVDLLRKRSQVLGIDGTGGISEETRDKVLDGEIIFTVLKMGLEAIHEVEFIASLLHVIASCEDLEGFSKVKDKIIDILREDFSECGLAWDTLAREALFSGSSLNTACSLYEEGLSQVQELEELEELIEYYIETLENLPLLLDSKESLGIIGEKLTQVFELAHKKNILKEKFYSEWISLLDVKNDESKMASILLEASALYPKSLILLKERISHSLVNENIESLPGLIELFLKGIKNIPREESSFPIEFLEFMFVNISARDGNALHDFYLKCRGGGLSWEKAVRLLYFDHLYTVKGSEVARAFYNENKYDPPFDLDFHNKALELEKSALKVDKCQLRNIFDAATDQFGKENIDIWLKYISFETKNGNSSGLTTIASRAENSLKTLDLKTKFRIEFELR